MYLCVGTGKKNLKAYIPYSEITKQVIVKGFPFEYSEDDLANIIEFHCPYYMEPINIVKIKRFYTKNNSEAATSSTENTIPTKTVLFTVEVSDLPKEAYISRVLFNTYRFYPKVRQCYRCFQFGHVVNICKSREK